MTVVFFSLHSNHAPAIHTFRKHAIHKPPMNPAPLLVKNAPDMAPAKSNMAPRNRRFLSAFSGNGAVNSCASLIKSQYKLVNTTVGIALYFSARLATIWPALWNANSATGPKSVLGNALGSVKVRKPSLFDVTTVGGWFGTAFVVAMMLTMPIKRAWRLKEKIRTQRRCGPNVRCTVLKKRAPRAKQRTATRDLDQA